MNSRYCEVDLLSNTAAELFWNAPRGWERVQAVCGWVHNKVTFGYEFSNPTRTALGVYTERVGVCRDFQHLAITFCRALNIPARYATGYLGDIGVIVAPSPMDFSAWFEVYLGNRWWTFDARHNIPRIGRVLMATGRDATDCAITTSFGRARLTHFEVITDEVQKFVMCRQLFRQNCNRAVGVAAGRVAGIYCLNTNGGPLTRFPLRSTVTSTRSAILTKGIPLFIP